MTTLSTIIEALESRGLLFQISDREALVEKSQKERLTVYAGFDPTADSLHIGNLLPIVALMRFQKCGHVPIALVGGATGLIGDPSGKAAERTLNTEDVVKEWTHKLKVQLSRFLDFDCENAAQMVNNYDWISKFDVITYMRDVGKYFTVNYMLNKDSVENRIEKGISYTEFGYMILQAFDFMHLNDNHGCNVQIGGSDQWGNITAGLELIRKKTGKEAFGVTFPLITKADGTKFGKTESGTIWLDADKTSPYEFYQFWLNVDDRDVIKLIKFYTFVEDMASLEEAVANQPEKREAQKVLANEVTTLVHGADAAIRAQNISVALFGGNVKELSALELDEAYRAVPSGEVSEVLGMSLVDLLIQTNLATSKRQARESLSSGGIYINGQQHSGEDRTIEASDLLFGNYLVLRKGRKNYFFVKVV